jgi:hypothetical protein
MKRLDAIARRRAELLSACAATQAQLARTRAGLVADAAWAGMALAAGKTIAAKPWLRLGLTALLALVAWRRGKTRN